MRPDTPTPRATARLLFASLAVAFAASARANEGPSFDCARATSKVNRMICASTELSELDRLLAEHYRVLLAQSGSEAPALQKEEQQWLRQVRDPCPDAACIAQAYEVWDAVLVARSRRLASAGPDAVASPPVVAPASPPPGPARRPPVVVATAPTRAPALAPVPAPVPVPAPAPAPRAPNSTPPSPAAAAETVPFPVDLGILADARALRGRACAPGEDVPRETGFVPVPGQLPVVSNGSVVLVLNHLDADFAFLLDTRHAAACRIVDVVALPPHLHVSHLLQCMVPSNDRTATPLSLGIGLRRPGQPAPIAYWEIDLAHGQFIRQPLGVLDWARKLECRQPEIGD
jgi:uncharacterized protein YecT (DUF1311 family)